MLSLSIPYMRRELVYPWVTAYLKRNKIGSRIVTVSDTDDTTIERLSIIFGSVRQLNEFVRRGNGRFPYFEFL